MQAIILFFEHSGDFVRSALVCEEPQQAQLQDTADRIKRALEAPAHVCQCGGRCTSARLRPFDGIGPLATGEALREGGLNT
jgi:hypothetical protein